MKPMLIYLLETLFCSGLLLLFYRLLVVERVSLTAARCYLIGAMVASVVIPALQLPLYPAETIYYAVPILETATATTSAADMAEPMQTVEEAVRWEIPWSEAVMLLYSIVVVVAFVLLVAHLRKIVRLRHRATCTVTPRYTLAESNEIQSPFSFWRTIFLGTGYDPLEREQIIAHEAAHIRRHHTVDKLLMELLRILYWFNPFLWLAERRLSEIHEYQADRDVLAEGYDITQYRLTIFKQLFGYNPDIACGLSNSFTKKRFIMMAQSSARRRSLWRIGAAIPLMAVLVLAFGATAREGTTPEKGTQSTTLQFHRPSAGRVLMSRFGTTKNPVTGKTTTHPGIDIVLSKGAAIYAVADGEVTYAADKGGYGNLIELTHEEGYTSRYAHLDQLLVEAGDTVRAGQKIATAGNTGRTTGVHLHFELHQAGTPIDPSFLMQSNASYVELSEDQCFLNGELIENDEALSDKLRELRESADESEPFGLILTGDPDIKMKGVTDVKEAARTAGVYRISYKEAIRFLPPKENSTNEVTLITQPKVQQRNALYICINRNGKYLAGTYEPTLIKRGLEGVIDLVRRFLDNPDDVRELSSKREEAIPLPDGSVWHYPVSQGFIMIRTRPDTPFEEFKALQSALTELYHELRNRVAREKFGREMAELSKEELQAIHRAVPIRIVEIEPTNAEAPKE